MNALAEEMPCVPLPLQARFCNWRGIFFVLGVVNHLKRVEYAALRLWNTRALLSLGICIERKHIDAQTVAFLVASGYPAFARTPA